MKKIFKKFKDVVRESFILGFSYLIVGLPFVIGFAVPMALLVVGASLLAKCFWILIKLGFNIL